MMAGNHFSKSLSPFSSRFRRSLVGCASKTLFRVRLPYRQLRRLLVRSRNVEKWKLFWFQVHSERQGKTTQNTKVALERDSSWLLKMMRITLHLQSSKHSRVCAEHFSKDSFEKKYNCGTDEFCLCHGKLQAGIWTKNNAKQTNNARRTASQLLGNFHVK